MYQVLAQATKAAAPQVISKFLASLRETIRLPEAVTTAGEKVLKVGTSIAKQGAEPTAVEIAKQGLPDSRIARLLHLAIDKADPNTKQELTEISTLLFNDGATIDPNAKNTFTEALQEIINPNEIFLAASEEGTTVATEGGNTVNITGEFSETTTRESLANSNGDGTVIDDGINYTAISSAPQDISNLNFSTTDDVAASEQTTKSSAEPTAEQRRLAEPEAENQKLKEQADSTKKPEGAKLKLDEPSKSKEIDDIASSMGEILQGEIDNFHDMTSWALKAFFWCKGWKCDENAAKNILSKVATKKYRENLFNFLEAVHTGKKEDARFASCTLSSDEKIATIEKTALAWTGRFLNMFHKTPEAILNFFAGATALLGKFRWLLLRVPGIKAIYHLPFASESIEAAGGWAGRYINQIKEAKKNYGELVKRWKPESSTT